MRFDYPEGATPIDDISGLIPDWVRTQEDLNLVEAENISQAVRKYLTGRISLPHKWFTVSFLKQIHYDMLGEVWDWAGNFRVTNTIPGVTSYRIRSDLESLCAEVLFWSSDAVELTLIEQAARIHHQLVFIHPFPNGNGRFSRIVADRFLKALQLSSPQWPPDLGGDSQHRKSYISALKNADKGDLGSLVSFMEKHGAKDPPLSQILGSSFFKKLYQGKKLELLQKAYVRRGYDV